MREIKCRAKVSHIDGVTNIFTKHQNGEWVYGEPHINCKFPHIHITHTHKEPIDLNTLGLFSGFIDKNENNIFEFDIVKNQWGGIGIVVLHNGCWSIKWDEDEIHFLYAELEDHIEVIGNKFDNPELLEGGEK